jgi:hypothetical protein
MTIRTSPRVRLLPQKNGTGRHASSSIPNGLSRRSNVFNRSPPSSNLFSRPRAQSNVFNRSNPLIRAPVPSVRHNGSPIHRPDRIALSRPTLGRFSSNRRI